MPQSQPRPQNYKGLAWVAAMALFMQSLDATILNTALPSIASDLHEPAFEMQMAIIAYSLSVALFIPLTAWAAAKFGTLTFSAVQWRLLYWAPLAVHLLLTLTPLCLHAWYKALAVLL